ncbi:3162_t:CDS:2, partial [Scutellospora calospora]
PVSPQYQLTSQPVAYKFQQSPIIIPVNDGVDTIITVLFPNTSRRSRSSTPTLLQSSTPTLPENFYFEDINDWSYSLPRPIEPSDDYEAEILKEGLNLPSAYFENVSKNNEFQEIYAESENSSDLFLEQLTNFDIEELTLESNERENITRNEITNQWTLDKILSKNN